MNPTPNQQAEQFREPGLVTAFQVIATLSFLAGAILALAFFTKEYALALLGISAILSGLIMLGFAAVISNLAEITWRFEKANKKDGWGRNRTADTWIFSPCFSRWKAVRLSGGYST